MTIFVNSPPSIIIEVPGFVKTGETATLDATDSFDPEGGGLEYIWDFDKTYDSDGDGDPTRDADATSSTCLLYTSPSPRDQRGSRMPSSA